MCGERMLSGENNQTYIVQVGISQYLCLILIAVSLLHHLFGGNWWPLGAERIRCPSIEVFEASRTRLDEGPFQVCLHEEGPLFRCRPRFRRHGGTTDELAE